MGLVYFFMYQINSKISTIKNGSKKIIFTCKNHTISINGQFTTKKKKKQHGSEIKSQTVLRPTDPPTKTHTHACALPVQEKTTRGPRRACGVDKLVWCAGVARGSAPGLPIVYTHTRSTRPPSN